MRINPSLQTDSVIRVVVKTPEGEITADQFGSDPLEVTLPEGVTEDDVEVLQLELGGDGRPKSEPVCLKAKVLKPQPPAAEPEPPADEPNNTNEDQDDGVEERLQGDGEASQSSEEAEGSEEEVNTGLTETNAD